VSRRHFESDLIRRYGDDMGILNDMTGRSLGRNGSAKRRVAIVASVALLVPACLLGLLYASGPDKYVATGTFYYWFHGLEQTAGRGDFTDLQVKKVVAALQKHVRRIGVDAAACRV